MRGMRRRAVFALLLLLLCVPAMHVSAEAGGGQAEYTVEYIARDQGTETLLARDTYRPPAGRRVNVPHRDFDHCKKEPGQDIRDQMGEVEEPVRQGYIFQGWDQELPEVLPEGETVLKALWEPGESQYTVLRWMENAEDEGYTLLGETEVRTGRTGSRVTASREDVERAGEMADWFPDSEYYGDYYGFDYARCDDTVVTADGKAVLNLYYDREIWTIRLHEEAAHESDSSDSLIPNEEVWYTAQGKYGAPLPEDFPSYDEMEKHYMERTQHQDMEFLGVRDEFEATGRHLDSFYFQDLALGNHTFDAYPWLERDSYTVYLTYFKERSDGTYRKVRQESVQVDKDPTVYGAEVTVLHPKGLTCEESWYTTGASPEACEQGNHIYIYMKRDTFRLDYVDVSDQGESRVLYTEEVTYRDEVALAYIPENEAEHKNQKFTGWYLSPALTSAGEPLQGFLMPSDHVRVYAGWTPADRTVKFDVQADPEEVSNVPTEQSVRAGKCVREPETPIRAGYIFLGWFEEPSGGEDTRTAWDFGKPVEEDLTLYAGWIPEEDTEYTIRHVEDESGSLFYEERGTGTRGDRIIVQPLDPWDPAYPADREPEADQQQMVRLVKEKSGNVYTIRYKGRKAAVLPDSSSSPDGSGEAPDTGDRAQAAGWFVMAAMGLGGVVLAGKSRWKN